MSECCMETFKWREFNVFKATEIELCLNCPQDTECVQFTEGTESKTIIIINSKSSLFTINYGFKCPKTKIDQSYANAYLTQNELTQRPNLYQPDSKRSLPCAI